MDRLDAIAAIIEIRRVKARYCRGVDLKDWALVASTLSPDSVLDFRDNDTMDRAKVLTGRDAIVDTVRTLIGPHQTVHNLFEPDIAITPPTTATGIWPLQHVVVLASDESGQSKRVSGWGYYHDTYELIDGHWLIKSQRREQSGHHIA